MTEKDEGTTNKEPTLRDIHERLARIDEHLKQQDERAKREIFFAMGAFGTSVLLVGITLRVTNPSPSPIDVAMSALLTVWGFGIVTWTYLHFRKIKSKSKP